MPKFDLEKTQAVSALFQTPHAQRDDAWRKSFYAAIVDASMRAFDPQVFNGPDGFSYFGLALPAEGSFTPFCISHILDHVLDSGLGVAVFASSGPPSDPEWVFSYGDLLSLSLYGGFEGDPAESAHQHDRDGLSTERVDKARKILVASPSESFYPQRAVNALKRFMHERLRIPNPDVKLIVDPASRPAQSIAINLRPADYGGDTKRLGAAMNYVRWFLPRTHGLVSLP